MFTNPPDRESDEQYWALMDHTGKDFRSEGTRKYYSLRGGMGAGEWLQVSDFVIGSRTERYCRPDASARSWSGFGKAGR